MLSLMLREMHQGEFQWGANILTAVMLIFISKTEPQSLANTALCQNTSEREIQHFSMGHEL